MGGRCGSNLVVVRSVVVLVTALVAIAMATVVESGSMVDLVASNNDGGGEWQQWQWQYGGEW